MSSFIDRLKRGDQSVGSIGFVFKINLIFRILLFIIASLAIILLPLFSVPVEVDDHSFSDLSTVGFFSSEHLLYVDMSQKSASNYIMEDVKNFINDENLSFSKLSESGPWIVTVPSQRGGRTEAQSLYFGFDLSASMDSPRNYPLFVILLSFIRYMRSVPWMARDLILVMGQDPTSDTGKYSSTNFANFNSFINSYTLNANFPGGRSGILRSVMIVRRPSAEFTSLRGHGLAILNQVKPPPQFAPSMESSFPTRSYWVTVSSNSVSNTFSSRIEKTDFVFRIDHVGAGASLPNQDYLNILQTCMLARRAFVDSGSAWSNLIELMTDEGALKGHSTVLAHGMQGVTLTIDTDLNTNALSNSISRSSLTDIVNVLECHQRKQSNMNQALHHSTNSYLLTSSTRYVPLSALLIICVLCGFSPLFQSAFSIGMKSFVPWVATTSVLLLAFAWSLGLLVTIHIFKPTSVCVANPIGDGTEIPTVFVTSSFIRTIVNYVLGVQIPSACFTSRPGSQQDMDAREELYISNLLCSTIVRFMIGCVCSLRSVSRLLIPQRVFVEVQSSTTCIIPPSAELRIQVKNIEDEENEWIIKNVPSLISSILIRPLFKLKQKIRRKRLLKETKLPMTTVTKYELSKRHLEMLVAKSSCGILVSSMILLLSLQSWPVALVFSLLFIPVTMMVTFRLFAGMESPSVDVRKHLEDLHSSVSEDSRDIEKENPPPHLKSNRKQHHALLSTVYLPYSISVCAIPILLFAPSPADSLLSIVFSFFRAVLVSFIHVLIKFYSPFEPLIVNQLIMPLMNELPASFMHNFREFPSLALSSVPLLDQYTRSFASGSLGANFWGSRWIAAQSYRGDTWLLLVLGMYLPAASVLIYASWRGQTVLREQDLPVEAPVEFTIVARNSTSLKKHDLLRGVTDQLSSEGGDHQTMSVNESCCTTDVIVGGKKILNEVREKEVDNRNKILKQE